MTSSPSRPLPDLIVHTVLCRGCRTRHTVAFIKIEDPGKEEWTHKAQCRELLRDDVTGVAQFGRNADGLLEIRNTRGYFKG